MKTLTVKLDSSLQRWVALEAKRLKLSKSGITRLALEKHRKGDTFISVHDIMKDVCGSVKSGPRDLATNPKYMKGFGQ